MIKRYDYYPINLQKKKKNFHSVFNIQNFTTKEIHKFLFF